MINLILSPHVLTVGIPFVAGVFDVPTATGMPGIVAHFRIAQGHQDINLRQVVSDPIQLSGKPVALHKSNQVLISGFIGSINFIKDSLFVSIQLQCIKLFTDFVIRTGKHITFVTGQTGSVVVDSPRLMVGCVS